MLTFLTFPHRAVHHKPFNHFNAEHISTCILRLTLWSPPAPPGERKRHSRVKGVEPHVSPQLRRLMRLYAFCLLGFQWRKRSPGATGSEGIMCCLWFQTLRLGAVRSGIREQCTTALHAPHERDTLLSSACVNLCSVFSLNGFYISNGA